MDWSDHSSKTKKKQARRFFEKVGLLPEGNLTEPPIKKSKKFPINEPIGSLINQIPEESSSEDETIPTEPSEDSQDPNLEFFQEVLVLDDSPNPFRTSCDSVNDLTWSSDPADLICPADLAQPACPADLADLADLDDFDSALDETPSESEHVKKFLDGILEIMLKSNTYEIFNDILKLTNQTLCNEVPKTYKTLINRVLKGQPGIEHYITCPGCQLIFGFRKAKNCSAVVCSGCSKQINLKDHNSKNASTVSLSLENQISKLSEHFNDLDGLPQNKEDAFELEACFSLDAVPLSKSSVVQLVPVHLYILNISDYKARNQLSLIKSFTVLKPGKGYSYEQMLKPLIVELSNLREGFQTNWSRKTKIKIKVFLADAVARAPVLNILGHNGEYPCHRCLVHIIPKRFLKPNQKKEDCYLVKSDDIQRRTKNHFEDSVACVQKSNTAHDLGVKGSTILSQIDGFDFVTGTLAEFMHVSLLGLTRLFLNAFWRDSGNVFYLPPEKKRIVNSRVESL